MLIALPLRIGQSDEAKVIAYAKLLDAAALEPTLKKQSLENWIKSLNVTAGELTWRQTDCAFKPNPERPTDPLPLCAEFIVTLGDAQIVARMVVGAPRRASVASPDSTACT
jgi:hypothetical protein